MLTHDVLRGWRRGALIASNPLDTGTGLSEGSKCPTKPNGTLGRCPEINLEFRKRVVGVESWTFHKSSSCSHDLPLPLPHFDPLPTPFALYDDRAGMANVAFAPSASLDKNAGARRVFGTTVSSR